MLYKEADKMKQDYESLKKVLNNIVEELENKLPEKSKVK